MMIVRRDFAVNRVRVELTCAHSAGAPPPATHIYNAHAHTHTHTHMHTRPRAHAHASLQVSTIPFCISKADVLSFFSGRFYPCFQVRFYHIGPVRNLPKQIA